MNIDHKITIKLAQYFRFKQDLLDLHFFQTIKPADKNISTCLKSFLSIVLIVSYYLLLYYNIFNFLVVYSIYYSILSHYF